MELTVGKLRARSVGHGKAMGRSSDWRIGGSKQRERALGQGREQGASRPSERREIEEEEDAQELRPGAGDFYPAMAEKNQRRGRWIFPWLGRSGWKKQETMARVERNRRKISRDRRIERWENKCQRTVGNIRDSGAAVEDRTAGIFLISLSSFFIGKSHIFQIRISSDE